MRRGASSEPPQEAEMIRPKNETTRHMTSMRREVRSNGGDQAAMRSGGCFGLLISTIWR